MCDVFNPNPAHHTLWTFSTPRGNMERESQNLKGNDCLDFEPSTVAYIHESCGQVTGHKLLWMLDTVQPQRIVPLRAMHMQVFFFYLTPQWLKSPCKTSPPSQRGQTTSLKGSVVVLRYKKKTANIWFLMAHSWRTVRQRFLFMHIRVTNAQAGCHPNETLSSWCQGSFSGSGLCTAALLIQHLSVSWEENLHSTWGEQHKK